jgi:tetratricopeptide (TPR) repeat protein
VQEGVDTRTYERVVQHRVQPGQSWESIAREYYGDASRADNVASFNMASPDHPPRAGSGLRVPIYKEDIDHIDTRLKAAAEYNMGLELAETGNFNGAAGKFRECLRLDPSFSDAAYNLAVAYQKQGLNDNAVTVLKDLVIRKPGRVEYWFALGNAQFHMARYLEASRSFQKAIEIEPGHLDSIYSLAVTFEKRGERGKAAQTWRRYLKIDSGSEWAQEASRRLRELEGG